MSQDNRPGVSTIRSRIDAISKGGARTTAATGTAMTTGTKFVHWVDLVTCFPKQNPESLSFNRFEEFAVLVFFKVAYRNDGLFGFTKPFLKTALTCGLL